MTCMLMNCYLLLGPGYTQHKLHDVLLVYEKKPVGIKQAQQISDLEGIIYLKCI